MSRSTARDTVFKIIYRLCLIDDGGDDFSFCEIKKLNSDLSEEDAQYIGTVYDGVCAHYDDLKQKISGWSQGFAIDRIFKVDLAILLVALYEIFYVDDVPPLVSLDEALNLAKLYSTEKSSVFIHGLLASALKECPEKMQVTQKK